MPCDPANQEELSTNRDTVGDAVGFAPNCGVCESQDDQAIYRT